MLIAVRCFGSLAGLGPDRVELNLPEGATVADALAALNLPAGTQAMPMLDGGPAGPGTALEDGAVLDLLPIVDGG